MNSKAFLSSALLILTAASHANAATVPAGFDFLTTQPGTFFNFGPGIGQVNLQGVPLAGSSPADTIMHRTQDATINGPSVPIQMVALSLGSVNPVAGFGGIPIFITLDPSNLAQNTGAMTISGGSSGGTFTSFFDVFFDVCAAPGSNGVGCIGPTLATGHETFNTVGSPQWTATPPSGAVDPNSGFYLVGTVTHVAPDGQHVVISAVTPLPTALPLFVTGLGALGLLGWRRKKKAAALAA